MHLPFSILMCHVPNVGAGKMAGRMPGKYKERAADGTGFKGAK